ncbi:MAG: hypothetical protein GYA14_04850 [Ignavibacteria bacterium]|nr:hypothetical protein [Ignavibacteria bacterium]
MKSKKAQESMTMRNVIILILVLLVILVVLVAFFKLDIVSLIRDRLPAYQAPPDNETVMTDDIMKYLNYEKIAKVDYVEKSGDSVKHYYLVFYKDYVKEKENIIATPIFIQWTSGSGINGAIKVVTPVSVFPPSFFNEEIGSMEEARLKIDTTEAEYLELKNKINNLPDWSLFIKLNDAKYIGGGIYKTKTQ